MPLPTRARGARVVGPRLALPLLPLALLLLFLLLLAPPASATDPGLLPGETAGHGAGAVAARWTSVHLSWKPRAQLLRGFLSHAECDALVAAASPLMEPSTVVNSTTGVSERSTVRTSTGYFFERGNTDVPIIGEIEQRVALATFLPVEHQEGLQILHYRDRQEYKAHHDFFWDEANQAPERGGQRLVTVLMYLSTPDEGGETVFPSAERRVTGEGWSDCARRGFAVHPQKGDALLFYGLLPDGEHDVSSLHASCPTLRGSKWSATKWAHVLPFAQPASPGGPEEEARAARVAAARGLCADQHEQCGEWSFFGECSKNGGYMHVACRAACRQCTNGTAGGLAADMARAALAADAAVAEAEAEAEADGEEGEEEAEQEEEGRAGGAGEDEGRDGGEEGEGAAGRADGGNRLQQQR